MAPANAKARPPRAVPRIPRSGRALRPECRKTQCSASLPFTFASARTQIPVLRIMS
jgi:hypothetical protein